MHAPIRSTAAGSAADLRRAALAVALAALFAAGCSGSPSTRRQLTERERDSTLGRSALPGASAVTRALKESDRATNAAHQLDQQVESQGP
jgi:hypothetical protein